MTADLFRANSAKGLVHIERDHFRTEAVYEVPPMGRVVR